MWRTFGVQTLTGSAQPILGDVLTAAAEITQDGTVAILTVGSTANKKYQQGDRLVLDPLQSNQDIVLVTEIISSTQLLCTSQNSKLHTHASNAIVQLAISCANTIMQAPSTNTEPVWVGTDNTVTNAGAGNAIGVMNAGGTFGDTGHDLNLFNTADLWMAGTASQTVIVAVEII